MGKHPELVTFDETRAYHAISCGQSPAVIRQMCWAEVGGPLHRIGIPDRFGESGSYAEILMRAGTDEEHVIAAVSGAIERKINRIVNRSEGRHASAL